MLQTSANLPDRETPTSPVLTSGSTPFNAGAVANDVQHFFRARLVP